MVYLCAIANYSSVLLSVRVRTSGLSACSALVFLFKRNITILTSNCSSYNANKFSRLIFESVYSIQQRSFTLSLLVMKEYAVNILMPAEVNLLEPLARRVMTFRCKRTLKKQDERSIVLPA